MMVKISESPMILKAQTAQELMKRQPVSICDFITIPEAAKFLSDKGLTAVPVVDKWGKLAGVLSQTDIVRYDREKANYMTQASYEEEDEQKLPVIEGFQLQSTDPTLVNEIMTPLVFAVRPNTPSQEVIQEMLERKVHHLFVIDERGDLVGVISTLDILRCLQL